MIRSIVPALVVVLSGCADTGGGQETGDVDDVAATAKSAVAEIRQVMENQAEAWNQGDLRGYMEGYAQTDTVRYASGGAVWRGWGQTLRRYQESYMDEGMMGELSFSDVDVWQLSNEHALVFGRWKLTRTEMYRNVGGLFTLLFERRPEGWRIVHDHTSSGETLESQQADTADAQENNAQQ